MAGNKLPDKSATAFVIVAMYTVPAARPAEGRNVADVPDQVIVPATGTVPCCKIKLAALIVAGFIASLKVAITFVVVVMNVAPFAGLVEITDGVVTSGGAAVEKLQT